MSKPKVKTYVYKDNKHIATFNSMQDASLATGDNKMTIYHIIKGKQQMSRKGFIYSNIQLIQEEIDKLPTLKGKQENEYITRFNDKCKEIIGKQELEIDPKDRNTFFIERTKKGRKLQIRQFIYAKCRDRWMYIPKKIALLERKYIDELINSL